MKDEKEIKDSSENSNEELESVLDKTDNYNEEQLEMWNIGLGWGEKNLKMN